MGLSETAAGQDLDHVSHEGQTANSITEHHVGDYSYTGLLAVICIYCDAFICNSSCYVTYLYRGGSELSQWRS